MRLSTQVYKKFFPDIAVGYEDPRMHVHIRDGKKLNHLFLTCRTNHTSLYKLCYLYNKVL